MNATKKRQSKSKRKRTCKCTVKKFKLKCPEYFHAGMNGGACAESRLAAYGIERALGKTLKEAFGLPKEIEIRTEIQKGSLDSLGHKSSVECRPKSGANKCQVQVTGKAMYLDQNGNPVVVKVPDSKPGHSLSPRDWGFL